MERELWEKIREMEIVGHVETSEMNDSKWEKGFKKFEWKSFKAVKEQRKGKAIRAGG